MEAPAKREEHGVCDARREFGGVGCCEVPAKLGDGFGDERRNERNQSRCRRSNRGPPPPLQPARDGMLFVPWLRARCKRAHQSTARRGSGVQLSTDGVAAASTSAAADASSPSSATANELQQLAKALAWTDAFVMRNKARRKARQKYGYDDSGGDGGTNSLSPSPAQRPRGTRPPRSPPTETPST